MMQLRSALQRLRAVGGKGLLAEAATLVSGNLLAQAISLAAYFLLTRIYSPSDYGLFNIFYSYIEVLIILSTCKYEVAIVAASSDAEAALLSRFALRLNAWVSGGLLTLVLALVLSGSLPGKLDQLGAIALLIPPMVFFCGTSRVYSFLFNRVRQYRRIALSETVNSAAGALLKALLGLLGLPRSGLPVGTVLGQAAANVNYRMRLSRLGEASPLHAEAKAAPRSALRSVARRYCNFPLYVAPKDLIASFSANLPFLWLALHFDHAEVGLFGLALAFTFRPVNILNGAFERVLYSRVAERVQHRLPIGRLIGHFLLIVNVVSLPVAALAWCFAEPVFAFLFGSRWVGTGVYVQALLPWVVAMLSAMSLMFIPNVFSTQRTEFFFGLAQLALRVAACAVGLAAGSFLLAVRLFSLASVVVCLGLLAWYLWQVRSYERTRASAAPRQ